MQKNPRVYVTLQFFTFSQQYTVYIIAQRAKNRAGFSHVRVCGLSYADFPQ
jgi:hypothetical protein